MRMYRFVRLLGLRVQVEDGEAVGAVTTLSSAVAELVGAPSFRARFDRISHSLMYV